MDTSLVICVGNVARGDDGVAHRVGRLLQAAGLPEGTTLLTAVDLDIAMAEDVATASRLVIIDAARRAEPAVATSPLTPGPATRPTGHAIDAASLLGIAEALYGSAPEATLVTVAAPSMEHTEQLSECATAASDEAAVVVRVLLAER